MAEFHELWAGGPMFAQAAHFRLSTDSVLLSDFVNLSGARHGIDLGCASGFIPLALAFRSPKLHMTGLELQEDAVRLAGENFEKNGISGRAVAVCGDIRNIRNLFTTGSFDLVTANPPYFPAGSGAVSPDGARASARSELTCTLEDICAAAGFLLKTGGSLCLVHKPERLADVIRCVSACGMEPKRLRFVSASPEKAPNLFLIEARRGGHPGMKTEPPLFLNNPDGSESEEYKRIYHR